MSLDALCKAVEAGEQEESRRHAQDLVDGGTDPLQIIEALTKVMDGIGERFSRLEIFLPEMMLSGDAMAGVVELLTPLLKEKDAGYGKGRSSRDRQEYRETNAGEQFL